MERLESLESWKAQTLIAADACTTTPRPVAATGALAPVARDTRYAIRLSIGHIPAISRIGSLSLYSHTSTVFMNLTLVP